MRERVGGSRRLTQGAGPPQCGGSERERDGREEGLANLPSLSDSTAESAVLAWA